MALGSKWSLVKQAQALADVETGGGTTYGYRVKAAVAGRRQEISAVQIFLTADLAAALKLKLVSVAESSGTIAAGGGTQTLLWAGTFGATDKAGVAAGIALSERIEGVAGEAIFLLADGAATLDINVHGFTRVA